MSALVWPDATPTVIDSGDAVTYINCPPALLPSGAAVAEWLAVAEQAGEPVRLPVSRDAKGKATPLTVRQYADVLVAQAEAAAAEPVEMPVDTILDGE